MYSCMFKLARHTSHVVTCCVLRSYVVYKNVPNESLISLITCSQTFIIYLFPNTIRISFNDETRIPEWLLEYKTFIFTVNSTYNPQYPLPAIVAQPPYSFFFFSLSPPSLHFVTDVLITSATINPNNPIASAKINMRMRPTYTLGCLPTARTP